MAGFGHQAINYCCPRQNLNTANQEGLAVEPKSLTAKSNPSNPYVDLLRNDVPEQISNIETSQNDVEELAKVEPIYPSSMAEFFNKINFKFYDNLHIPAKPYHLFQRKPTTFFGTKPIAFSANFYVTKLIFFSLFTLLFLSFS